MRALVLSGGGSKGAFQLGALNYLADKGITFDYIYGVSVGALNGYMVAADRLEELNEIWHNMSNDKVYTGGLNFSTMIKLLFGKRHIYSNKPLKSLLEKYVLPAELKREFYSGIVNFNTGEYHNVYVNKLNWRKAVDVVLASTVMPIIWEPYKISNLRGEFVDGGLRDITPLRGALTHEDVDEVVIVKNNPPTKNRSWIETHNILEVIQNTFSIINDETMNNDVDGLLRVNELVLQSESQGYKLLKRDGTPYKYFKHTIIEPEANVHDTLDFSQTSIRKTEQIGYRRAENAYN